MLLDYFLLLNLSNISNVKKQPSNLNDVILFFKNMKHGLDVDDERYQFIGLIFFKFLTAKNVRKRKTTARVFEDIMSYIFKGKILDNESRTNPSIPDFIKKYDKYSKSYNFKVSQDLAGNKREKADNSFGEYYLSLKTLTGKLYDKQLKIIDGKYNKELNIGSLSARALLVGLLTEEELSKLSERKGGLGSKEQLINTIYKPLKKRNKWDEFIDRLKVFLDYIYAGSDFIIMFKDGYKMKLVFIHENDFIDNLIEIARADYDEFFSIFYRWENNNLRIHYEKLFKRIKSKGKLTVIELNFDKVGDNESINKKLKMMKSIINENLCKFN